VLFFWWVGKWCTHCSVLQCFVVRCSVL